MNEIKRKVKYKSEKLAGFKLPCYVLEDGTRILSTRGMQEALKMVDENSKHSPGGRLVENLSQKSLQPFISKEKRLVGFEPIICYDGNKEIHGYEATVLVDICNVYIEARKHLKLSPRQKIIADQCGIILGAFAKVGIYALIDEATGYQYERERDELQKQLQKILGLYVSDKPLKWEKIFPWTFYKQLFRLWGQPFTVEVIIKPGFIGRLTNKYVYQNLPQGILEKLKEKTPKTQGGNYKHKLHQLLTTKVGREDLRKTINSIETLASVSEDKPEFEKLEAKYRQQKELLYTGLGIKRSHPVDTDEQERVKEDFDRKFKALLNVPPPKKDE